MAPPEVSAVTHTALRMASWDPLRVHVFHYERRKVGLGGTHMLCVEAATRSLRRHRHHSGRASKRTPSFPPPPAGHSLPNCSKSDAKRVLQFYFLLTSLISSEICDASVCFLGRSLLASSAQFSVNVSDPRGLRCLLRACDRHQDVTVPVCVCAFLPSLSRAAERADGNIVLCPEGLPRPQWAVHDFYGETVDLTFSSCPLRRHLWRGEKRTDGTLGTSAEGATLAV